MKLDTLLSNKIKAKLKDRKPLFFTRVKFFMGDLQGQQWAQNCKGILILYTLNQSHYIAILNITRFQIEFDMELFTHFYYYCKFHGKSRVVFFQIPMLNSDALQGLFVFESPQQVMFFKVALQKQYCIQDQKTDLDFFKKPEVIQLITLAEIPEKDLQVGLVLKQSAKQQIENYLQELENQNKKIKQSGFKAYSLGREDTLEDQKQYLMKKKKQELIQQLKKLHKQHVVVLKNQHSQKI